MAGSLPPHSTSLRVRYGEVDRMGVVYHPNYLVYFERGRTEYLRSLGDSYRRIEDDGTLLVVVETGVRHHRPAEYDDLLSVRTCLTEIRAVRMRFDYEVARGEETLATGFTVLAATDPEGRLRRLPTRFKERIEAVVTGAADGKAEPSAAVQGGTS